MSPSVAVGTDLAYSIPAKWVGAWQHYRQGNVRWQAVWFLARGSLPTALAGAYAITRWVRLDHAMEGLLRQLLGGTLLFVSLLSLWQISRLSRSQQDLVRDVWYHHPLVISLWGGMVGLLVGITSIGSGSLVVPFLLLLPLSAQEVVGTDVAHAAILVTAAGTAYILGETVDIGLALNLLVGAVPGIVIGSRLTRVVSERLLRGALAVLLLLTALHLLGVY